MKKLAILHILIFCQLSFSQITKYEPAVWRMMDLNGELSLYGFYNSFNDKFNNSNNLYYGGGGMVNLKSYIWHPNFLTLNIGGSYSPQQGEYNNSGLPGFNSNSYNKNLSISATFLKNSPYNFLTYLGLNQNYIDIENLRTVKRDQNRWGGNFTLKTKYLIWINFEQNDEKETDQIFDSEIDRKNTLINFKIEKSFFEIDRNEIHYRLNNFSTEQKGLFQNANNYNFINFKNSLQFEDKINSQFLTNLYFSNITGSVNQKNFGGSENINFKIWDQVDIIGQFNYNQQERELLGLTKMTGFAGRLQHKLYESLSTGLFYNYERHNTIEVFNLETNNNGFILSYNKKLKALKGFINVVYSHNETNRKNIFKESSVSTYEERYQLTDGEITLLNNNNILKETIIIWDETRTLIYEEFTDYLLIERANTIEIQRVLGGRIPNNSFVFIDYQSNNNISFNYSGRDNNFKARLTLYNNLIDLVYTNSKKSFNSDVDISLLPIESFKKNTYSISLNLKNINTGIKYDNHISSLFPYKLLSYYFDFKGKITNKIYYSINGNVNDYLLYFREGLKQKDVTLFANFIYNINYKTKLNTSFNYLDRSGLGQDIKLLMGRSEISTRINQLSMSLGVNFYNRKISELNQNYLGVNFKLSRRF